MFCVCCTFQAFSQIEAPAVQLSQDTVVVDGKSFYLHTVQPRQTLYSIAKKYDVTVDEIYFNNPTSKEGIQPGQVLRIPVINKETEIIKDMKGSDFDFIYHIVNKGDNLSSIAELYEIDPFDLKLANPNLKEPLKQGEYVRIPVLDTEVKDDHKISAPQAHANNEMTMTDGSGNSLTLQMAEPPMDKTKPYMINNEVFYEIQPKETLFGLCRKFKLTRAELETANPGITASLQVGQLIMLPAKVMEHFPEPQKKVETNEVREVPQNKNTGLKTHVVVRKETLYSIARKYGVSIEELKTYNPGLTDKLSDGQVIKIPATKITEPFIEHKVEKKTKLNKIARKYGLSYREIQQSNPEAGRKVSRGDIIRIPVSRSLVTSKVEETNQLIDKEELDQQEAVEEELISGITHTEEFKVALMVPMSLENLDTLYQEKDLYPEKVFNSPSLRYLQFVEGFKVAADSLAQLGMNLKLYIYDVDANITKTVKLLQKEELKEMNLIVGPFYSRSFSQVSNFAKFYNIPVINPLTNRSEVLVNSDVFKVKPGIDFQGDVVVDVLRKQYPNSNIILINNPKETNFPEYRDLKSKIFEYVPSKVSLQKADMLQSLKGNGLYNEASVLSDGHRIEVDRLKADPHAFIEMDNKVHQVEYGKHLIDVVKANLSKVRPNVIIVATKNKVTAVEVLDQLNQVDDEYPLNVIGIPLWASYDKLNLEYLINLNTTIISEDYIDYSKQAVKSFVYKFRDEYQTEPNKFAFEGYDIGFYFMSLLGKCGKDFEECLPEYHPQLLKRKMFFYKSRRGGYENTYWIPLKYEGAKLVPLAK